MHNVALRVSVALLALPLAIALAVLVAGRVESQQPESRPEKLDAVLFAAFLAEEREKGATGAAAPSAYRPAEGPPPETPRVVAQSYTDEAGRTFINGLIKTDGSLDGIEELGVVVQSVVGTVVAARIPVDALARLTALPNVEFLQAARRMKLTNDVSVPSVGAPRFHDAGIDGAGVIVGVIDSGVDFTHDDFRNADGTTRLKFICDQTDPPQGGDNKCPGNGTPEGGTLWTEAQINGALQSTGTVRQVDNEGHGTHVMGTAAGNDETYGGVAPGADLIMVKTSLFDNDIVSAIGFIDEKAAELAEPYVVNMSLGSDLGPHDGSDALSAAIDGLVGAGTSSKAVVVSAGNSGGLKIHASGEASSGTTTVDFFVPAVNVLHVDIWYDGSDSFSFGFKDRDGDGLSGIGPGETRPGDCKGALRCVDIVHTNTLSANNSKQVIFKIYGSSTSPIALPGPWSFTLAPDVVVDGSFHVWCDGCTFTGPEGDSAMTLGAPGVAKNAITVASHVTKECWESTIGTVCYGGSVTEGDISSFSSTGPTRDGRQKPDISAPGQGIVSAKSADGAGACAGGAGSTAPDGEHANCQGTSMSSPHVAGAVALILAEDPTLDAVEIKARLQADALRDSFTGDACNNTWGCGKLQIAPQSADLTVDTLVDELDGSCVTDCSLRDALQIANTDGEPNQITFGVTGVISLTSTFGTLTLSESSTAILGVDQQVTVDGSGLGGTDVITVSSDGNTIEGLVVTGAPNSGNGITITSAGNTIGGMTSSARNVISGNTGNGVLITGSGATGNVVQGNFIGTDATGAAELPNSFQGVVIQDAPANIIGGTTAGSGNVVSGNDQSGVTIAGVLSTANLVQGNLIGTNASGTAPLGNGLMGIGVTDGATGNTIGGTTPDERNVISGNAVDGVFISVSSTTENIVRGNCIGSDVTGTLDVGNTGGGVNVSGNSNTIGGTDPAEGNIIVGNFYGVRLSGSGNLVQGNSIGVGAAGGALGNDGNGVIVAGGASNNTIGGSADGAPNTIAHNLGAGVFVGSGTGNAILSNSLFANLGLGIDLATDLGPDGVTANDAGDADAGPNNLQNFPVIAIADIDTSGDLLITYSVDSTTTSSTYPLLVQFFRADADGEEGQLLLGGDIYATSSAQSVKVANLGSAAELRAWGGKLIVATATDDDGNTSEFSASVGVTGTAVVPGVTQWGLLAMAALVAGVAVWRARKTRRRPS